MERTRDADLAIPRRVLLGRAAVGTAAALLAQAGFGPAARGAAEGRAEPKVAVETATAKQCAEALERLRYHRRTAFRPLIAAGKLAKEQAEIPADPAKDAACTRHAAYLALDVARFTNPLSETPGLSGYSEEGDAIARSSFHSLARTPRLAVDLMAMGVPWRKILLDPGHRTIHYGCAWRKGSSHGATVLAPSAEFAAARLDDPIVYPAPDQVEVPHEYYPAAADVVPPSSGKGGGGYPVSAVFYAPVECLNPRASLVDSRKKAVECWTSLPGKPAVENGYHAPNGIFLVPKLPLRKLERYTVKMSAELRNTITPDVLPKWEKEWSFQAALRPTDFSEVQITSFR